MPFPYPPSLIGTDWGNVRLVDLPQVCERLLQLVYGPPRQLLALLDVDYPLGNGVALRLDMRGRALAVIRDMPLTGIGLDTFPLVQSHFCTGYFIGLETHAQDLLATVVVDLGLPGLLAFLSLLIAFYLTVFQANRRIESREVRILHVGFSAAVAA